MFLWLDGTLLSPATFVFWPFEEIAGAGLKIGFGVLSGSVCGVGEADLG